MFKLDWALDGPIPWTAPEVARAATVHLGGTLEEIAEAEEAATRGRHPERPFVLLVQPSLFDPTRAPAGRHTAWAYCHVPNGSARDMTDGDRGPGGALRARLPRPDRGPLGDGQRGGRAPQPQLHRRRHQRRPQDLRQLFTRPVARPVPYSTPLPGVFLCSSSTPPGGGVHGMCGYWAARAALG